MSPIHSVYSWQRFSLLMQMFLNLTRSDKESLLMDHIVSLAGHTLDDYRGLTDLKKNPGARRRIFFNCIILQVRTLDDLNTGPHTCRLQLRFRRQTTDRDLSQMLAWSSVTLVERRMKPIHERWLTSSAGLCCGGTHEKQEKGEKEYYWNPGWQDVSCPVKGAYCKGTQHPVGDAFHPTQPDVES